MADPQAAGDYLGQGRRRLDEAAAVASSLPATVDGERAQWDIYYDSLEALERGQVAGEDWAHQVRTAAAAIIDLAAMNGATG